MEWLVLQQLITESRANKYHTKNKETASNEVSVLKVLDLFFTFIFLGGRVSHPQTADHSSFAFWGSLGRHKHIYPLVIHGTFKIFYKQVLEYNISKIKIQNW